MKKVFSLLAVLAVTVLMASRVWAALPTAQKAYANFGAEELSVNLELYTWQPNKHYTFGTGGDYTETTDKILFTLKDVNIGSADVSYSSGTVFARISSNLKKQRPNTTIYMYTKSTFTATAGDYEAKNPREEEGNTLYSGLVRTTNSTAYLDGDYAPIEMTFKKISDESIADGSYISTMSDKGDQYGEKYLVDHADSNFGDGAYAIIGISGSNGGIWTGTGEGEAQHYTDEDVIVFFGAKFNNVFAGDVFGNDSINIVTSAE